MPKPTFTDLNPAERKRTYRYSDGAEVAFFDVRRLSVSASGTHRLETGDGLKHIVPSGWAYITLDVDDWSL